LRPVKCVVKGCTGASRKALGECSLTFVLPKHVIQMAVLVMDGALEPIMVRT
jgi:hypothetical protein